MQGLVSWARYESIVYNRVYIGPHSAVSSESDCRNYFYSHSFPSADSSRAIVSFKQNYVHEVLVNFLVKLAQEKSVVRTTDHLNLTIADDWDVKPQPNKQLT